ncbi:MAG: hypothetical protein NTY35_12260, partial [Planctomycetota bacterium]|nr:hypothetical protein [Planctomycetota bacterium]
PFALAAVPGQRRVAVSCAARGELVLLDGGTQAITARIAIARADAAATRAWPVLVDPDARHAFVAIPGENRVVVLDLATRTIRGDVATGARPGALAWAFQRSVPGAAAGMGIDP